MEQHVVEGLLPLPGGLHEDLQVVRHRLLPGEFTEATRTQDLFQLPVGSGPLFVADVESLCHGDLQR